MDHKISTINGQLYTLGTGVDKSKILGWNLLREKQKGFCEDVVLVPGMLYKEYSEGDSGVWIFTYLLRHHQSHRPEL